MLKCYYLLSALFILACDIYLVFMLDCLFALNDGIMSIIISAGTSTAVDLYVGNWII